MKTSMTLAGIAATMLVGCATTDPIDQPVGLDGTGWTLVALRGETVPSVSRITMGFEDGRVQGSDGCNRYAGRYAVTGSQFRAGEKMISTQMACPEPVMRQAKAFLAALHAAVAFRRNGPQLTLLDAGGNVLLAFSAQSMTLGGTSWRVMAYNDGRQAVVSVVAGSALTAEFTGDGRLVGSAGCNRYTASYTTSGSTIRITRAAATRKHCTQPPGVMEQEARYLKALSDSTMYRMEGGRLELRTATGALAVTLTAAGPP